MAGGCGSIRLYLAPLALFLAGGVVAVVEKDPTERKGKDRRLQERVPGSFWILCVGWVVGGLFLIRFDTSYLALGSEHRAA